MKNKDNKHSNYLIILLVVILLGVIGYKIYENYNIKHYIFEEQEVARVKVEILENNLIDEEHFYKLNFTDKEDIVKVLTVRNRLREKRTGDNTYDGLRGNVHFTIYDEDGRERYEEFNDIFIEKYVFELLDLNSAKKQYIDLLNVESKDVKKITITNPYTEETVEIINNDEIVSDYSGYEIVDSLMIALKDDIMDNNYYNISEAAKFIIKIDTDRTYETAALSNYKNTLDIVKAVSPEVEFGFEDIDSIIIEYNERTVEISNDEIEEFKDAISDALECYVPFTDRNSAVTLEITLNEEHEMKKVYGSIFKDNVTENIFDLFE